MLGWRRFFALWLLVVVAPLEARQVRLTIFHTTDLHGHVEQLARAGTVVRQARASASHVLLVDNGDTIQGTAVSRLSGGKLMVRVMNALKYDAWVLGNHEFDWGMEKLTNCLALAAMPVLAGNVGGLARVQPFLIREVEGVRVALIGLSTPGIPNWSRPRLIPGLTFSDSCETLRRVLPSVRAAGAELLVLVVHQGYKESGDDHANQIRAIAARFPELDLIIGGHTHRQFDAIRLGKTLYTQAGFHGQVLGRVDLLYDTEQRRVTWRRARNLHLDENTEPDAEVLDLAREDLAQAEKYLHTKLGEAADEFSPRGGPKRETPIHNLICESIAFALRERGAKVDAVVHGLIAERESLSKGPITVADIWRIVPYENTVGVVEVRLSQLREILEENAEYYGKHEFRGLWGLRYQLDPYAPQGHRVGKICNADGGSIGEDDRLAVAFNSYELASGGLRWKKLRQIADSTEAKTVEYDVGTRESVMEFIRRQRVVVPRTEGWWQIVESGRNCSKILAR